MKRNLLFLTAVFAGLMHAQPPSGKALPGTSYGTKITPAEAIAASQLPTLLAGSDTLFVKVIAPVKEVCAKKGCWFTFTVNDTVEAFVKMKDYAFFVPVDLEGKKAIVEGKAFTKTISVADQKHYAEDAKKSRKEIDAITAPKKEIRFVASGVLVAGTNEN
jgi:hypothetical protein